ncbi:transcriptional regulator [Seiridium cupressi]
MSVPADKTLEKELRLEAHALLGSGIEVTVNKVRTRVEEKLDLPEQFFKESPDWKDRSKQVIHKAIQGDESDEEPKKEEAVKPEKKAAVKRQSSEEPEQKPKRVKKEPAPKKAVKKEPAPKKAVKKAAPKKKKASWSESELSDLSDSDEAKLKKRGSKPQNKVESESELSDLVSDDEEDSKPKKVAGRGRPKKKAVLSDNEEDEVKSDPDSSSERKRKRPTKGTKVKSDSEDESAEKKKALIKGPEDEVAGALSSKTKAEDSDEDGKPRVATGDGGDSKAAADDDSSELSSVIDDEPPKKKKVKKEETKPAVDDDSSDLSSVADDAPPKKRKTKGSKASKAAPKPKASKPAPKEPTGDEAEIKKLQGQLVKCGIRKIWGIELKEYGDDSRGKIRHLRKMLTDAGMTGRFSEARAKEIKEQRELLADLGAVQEMNELWGSEGRGGRASRTKAKAAATMKEESEQESEAEETKPRVTKRMADLAFLGSESESD